ncbi:hypothetical protein, partial [Staphylococcus aureus]|uniref:hypothetical protein n=1 Tax=Staphylococcus aureus TaxID=1280 RepID=UPI00301D512C
MIRPFLLLLLPLPLLAAAATPIQPGKWRTTVTVVDMTMPGMPPGVAAMMKRKPTVVTACVTPADAAAGPRRVIEKTNG